jgi:hypothetical protein
LKLELKRKAVLTLAETQKPRLKIILPAGFVGEYSHPFGRETIFVLLPDDRVVFSPRNLWKEVPHG